MLLLAQTHPHPFSLPSSPGPQRCLAQETVSGDCHSLTASHAGSQPRHLEGNPSSAKQAAGQTRCPCCLSQSTAIPVHPGELLPQTPLQSRSQGELISCALQPHLKGQAEKTAEGEIQTSSEQTKRFESHGSRDVRLHHQPSRKGGCRRCEG